MNLEVFKVEASKHNLLFLNLSRNQSSSYNMVLFKDEYFESFIKFEMNNNEEGYYQIFHQHSPITSKKHLISTKDLESVCHQFANITFCSGFKEKLLKPNVSINDILISSTGDGFLIRSRKCDSIYQGNEVCDKCLEISTISERKANLNKNSCHACYKEMKSKTELVKHIRTFHPNVYKCSWIECGKSFGSASHLELHMKRHNKQFSFSCHLCDRGFVTQQELKMHNVCHQNLRSLMCVICGKLFLRKSNLLEHLKIHSEEKKYSCDLCDASFTRSGNLKTHKTRIHAGGVKQHECPTCRKRFHSLQQLTRHLHVHTGSRPHKCDSCTQAFSRPDHLKKHKLKVHDFGWDAVKGQTEKISLQSQRIKEAICDFYEINPDNPHSTSQNLIISSTERPVERPRSEGLSYNKSEEKLPRDNIAAKPNPDNCHLTEGLVDVSQQDKHQPVQHGTESIQVLEGSKCDVMEDSVIVSHDMTNQNILNLDLQEEVAIL